MSGSKSSPTQWWKLARHAAVWSTNCRQRRPFSSKAPVGMSPTTPGNRAMARGMKRARDQMKRARDQMERARDQLTGRAPTQHRPRLPLPLPQTRRRRTRRDRPTPKSRPRRLRLPQMCLSRRSSSSRSGGSRSDCLSAKCSVALRYPSLLPASSRVPLSTQA